ncbi:MAG: efflux RND transporter periplasmic adaptor subunit [Planctomycetes bacterium]|nr:efflux RND transporter periplasmic adaptor subunit [Planctomycetota bacterium]
MIELRSVPHCVAVVAIVLALAGCEEPKNAYVPPPPPDVTVARPAKTTIDDALELTGFTRGAEAVEIRARVKGFIERKLVQGGERVNPGDLLFTIDPRTFEAMVRQAEAEVAAAKAAMNLAEVTVARMQKARESNAVSAQDLDKAIAERDAALAQVALADAGLQSARLDLEFTQVRSPIAGRVSLKTIDVGQLVGANDATLLATVVREDKIYVNYRVDERQVIQLRKANQNKRPGEDGRPALPVFVALNGESEYTHRGTFRNADNTVDPTTGTLGVEAEFDNADGDLLPGYFVRVKALLGEREALMVPDIAVMTDQTGRFVYVVDAQGIAQRRDVVVGPVVDRQRTIESGLTVDDDVVVNGIMRVRPGSPVVAKKADGSPR